MAIHDDAWRQDHPASTTSLTRGRAWVRVSATAPSADALAFSGPAPERINGRLAMIGFVSAIAVEASTRWDGIFAQAANGTGQQAVFTYMVAALSVASLEPSSNCPQTNINGHTVRYIAQEQLPMGNGHILLPDC
ncbi:hypothetical protein EJB05_15362, partial [Eragrostis curvula]